MSAFESQVVTERRVRAAKSCGMRCPTRQHFGVDLEAVTFPNAVCLEADSHERTDLTPQNNIKNPVPYC